MPTGGNGNFIRTIFWALLIGSFAWATFIGISSLTAMNVHCSDAEAKMTAIKSEMIVRDEKNLELVMAEFKEINNALAEQRTDIKWIKEKVK